MYFMKDLDFSVFMTAVQLKFIFDFILFIPCSDLGVKLFGLCGRIIRRVKQLREASENTARPEMFLQQYSCVYIW